MQGEEYDDQDPSEIIESCGIRLFKDSDILRNEGSENEIDFIDVLRDDGRQMSYGEKCIRISFLVQDEQKWSNWASILNY